MVEVSGLVRERAESQRRPWMTLAHLASAAGGVAIVSQGVGRRDNIGVAATLGGAALAAWGTANVLATPRPYAFLRRSGGALLRALPQPGTTELHRAVTIGRPREELYRFWRDFANLAQLMPHVLEIRPAGERRWHWSVRGPGGGTAEWDAELVEERENERLAWRSVGEAEIANEGVVRFVPAPGDRGTEVHVAMSFRAPGGKVGRAIAWLFGEEPGKQLRDGLRRLKQKMETGEVPTITPQPTGRRDRKDAMQ